MINAICFSCGEAKHDALKLCGSCYVIPSSYEDQVISVALSADCIRQDSLKRAGEYIKNKGRLPRFHKDVEKKARGIVNQIQINQADSTQSFEFSQSFFDMGDLINEDSVEIAPKITVHTIGKPKHCAMNDFGNGAYGKTSHKLQWEIGRDVSAKDADAHMDVDGCLYVWFRWRGTEWHRTLISKAQYQQLRQMEQGK